MPIKDGIPFCVNHSNIQMIRNTGLSAVTSLERLSSGEVNFNPGNGVPVVLYYCDICGYIEMYAATKTPFWDLEKKKP